VLTAVAVAENDALAAPFTTVTEDGTVRFAMLLASVTVTPPPGALPVSDTVQLSVPAPVNDPLAQLRALNTGASNPIR
jgi:hypothetical protein